MRLPHGIIVVGEWKSLLAFLGPDPMLSGLAVLRRIADAPIPQLSSPDLIG